MTATTFTLGGDLAVSRVGFGAMRIIGAYRGSVGGTGLSAAPSATAAVPPRMALSGDLGLGLRWVDGF